MVPEVDGVESVLQLVRNAKTLPVGFMGSGFSKRYLDTPDWEGLLRYLANLTGQPLNRYLVASMPGKQDTFPDTATAIAAAFRDIWWNDSEYEAERREYGDLIRDVTHPFKIQIAKYLKSFKITEDPNLVRELEAFDNARFQTFVTTNYDSLLENRRTDYVTYGSQSKALFGPVYEIGEIYKIHGTESDFSSIVITRSDYDEFELKNPYLTSKMLTLFVENPVLFFGYSLNDPHVQRMLATLTKCLTGDQLSTLNERLIFIGRVSEERPERLVKAPIVVEGHTFHAYEIGLSDWAPLFEGLADIPYHFAPHVLRRLKDSVYQAAHDNDSPIKVRVVDFEEGDDMEQLEIVLGVGLLDKISRVGYSQVSVHDYLDDMLHGRSKLKMKDMASGPFLTYRQKYIPTHYAAVVARAQSSELDFENHRQLKKWQQNSESLAPYNSSIPEGYSFANIRELYDSDMPLYRKHDLALGIVSWSPEDIARLRAEVLGIFADDPSATAGFKLACLYDRLVFGRPNSETQDLIWTSLDLAIEVATELRSVASD